MRPCTTTCWLEDALQTLDHPAPSSVSEACCCASENAAAGGFASSKEDADTQLVRLVLWLEDRIIRLW
jgi:hypothetical protein